MPCVPDTYVIEKQLNRVAHNVLIIGVIDVKGGQLFLIVLKFARITH